MKALETLSRRRGTAYKGFANCRICKCRLGSCDEIISYHDKDYYIVPQGFIGHYVGEHNVKPSREFINWVLSRAKKKEHKDQKDSILNRSSRSTRRVARLFYK
jgi:hypothetical protein